MSQGPFAERSTSYKTFEQKSDNALRIGLAVGLLLIGGFAVAQWTSHGSAHAKPAASAPVKAESSEPVYRCADGGVSFKPCS